MLTTEEAIYRINPAPTDTSVTFPNVLFNPTGLSTQGFNWNVIASNTIGGTLNKCAVTNATNVAASGAITNPTGNITAPPHPRHPTVGLCTLTIGGTVSYSPRILANNTLAPTPAPPAGLELELRDIGENTVRTQSYTGAWGGAFTFNDASRPVQVREQPQRGLHRGSEDSSDRHGLRGRQSDGHPVRPTLTANPANITSPSVQCRETPALANRLRGVYRHVTTSWKKVATAAQDPNQVVTYNALDFSRHNTASSNMIAFFENGTYIYGTHANSAQIEHGFYDYDPVAHTLRFTLNADTNPLTIFPSSFTKANAATPSTVTTTTPGLSAVPITTIAIGGTNVPATSPNRCGYEYGGQDHRHIPRVAGPGHSQPDPHDRPHGRPHRTPQWVGCCRRRLRSPAR